MKDKELIAMMVRQIEVLTNTISMQEQALGLAADMLIEEQIKCKFLQEELYRERRCKVQ